MYNERVIDKIKKLYALANNNTSAEEAADAALKAQALMAKYNLSQAEISDAIIADKEDITTASVDVVAGRKWKFDLARIIARNFRCTLFFNGRRRINFYGYETDTIAASETFKFLFNHGHKLADSEQTKVYKQKGTTTGVYNSFTLGYIYGIRQKLDAQCTALMIVVPKEVTEQYAEKSKDWGSIKNSLTTTTSFDKETYEKGVFEGKIAMGGRQIC